MYKTLAGYLNNITVKSQDFQDFRPRIWQYNGRTLFIIGSAGTVLFALLTLFSLPFVGILDLLPFYAVLLAVFAVACVLSKTVLVRHTALILPMFYVVLCLIYLVAIYMGTFAGRTTNATTYLIALLLLPLFVIDRPWRLILMNFVSTALFVIAVLVAKLPGDIRSLDVSNAVVVFLLSAVFIEFTVQRHIRDFKAERREAEELEKKDRLINLLPVGVAAFEVRDGAIKQLFTNDEFYALFEDTREGRTKRNGGNFMNGIHPDDRAKLGAAIQSVIDGKDYISTTCRAQKGDGSYLWVRFASSVAQRAPGYLKVYSTYSSMEEEMKSKQATQAKSEFLSRMSHDIRTPMNAIIGLTRLAREETDPAMVNNYLDNISESSNFLLGLINDVLDLSQIESGRLTLNPEPYNGTEFITAMETIMRPMIEERQIEFVFRLFSEKTALLIDKLRFNQIFLNLLSNACKFTPAGGKIECTSEPLPPHDDLYGLRFTVRDNGIGMSREFQKIMFTPFSQERTALNDTAEGSGLGLPIVKSLVDAMGGTLTVNSELGQGTQYTLDFYFHRAAAVKQAAPQTSEESILRGAQILLVEDNELNILVARKLLETKGCLVALAHNGQEALDLFDASEPGFYNAVLMDVRMPVMDGLTATRRIRTLPREDAATVPIIAMTADAFTEEQKRTADAGMNYHLSKPIDPRLLFRVLADYIATDKRNPDSTQ